MTEINPFKLNIVSLFETIWKYLITSYIVAVIVAKMELIEALPKISFSYNIAESLHCRFEIIKMLRN